MRQNDSIIHDSSIDEDAIDEKSQNLRLDQKINQHIIASRSSISTVN